MAPEFWLQFGALLLSCLGSLAAVYGVLNGRISKTAKTLHEKVDEVKRDYVRRDDLREDLHNLTKDISRIERGQESIAAKVDGFAAALLPAIADLAKAAIAFRDK